MIDARGRRDRTRRLSPRAIPVLAALLAALGLGVHALAADGPRVDTYKWNLPAGMPKPAVPRNNPMNAAKVAIGRRLFYDKRLSGNATQSCSSCHMQKRAFTDGRSLAIGSTGEVHPRNAQSLVNVAYPTTLTWANPGLRTLERQVEIPLFGTEPVELGITDKNRGEVLRRLRSDRWYKRRVRRAFPGTSRLGWVTIVRSLAAFQRTIISANSRYDRSLRGRLRLTASETRGRQLFMGERAECQHCHGTFIFNSQVNLPGTITERPQFQNNGLFNIGGTGAFPEPNRGVFEFSGRPQDMGRFKAPSLRNVALTAPYMHDGSMATLREVVDHYASGGRVIPDGPYAGDGRKSPTKDPLIAGIDLSERDRRDLVAFLESLTDRSVTRNPRLSDPFKRRP